MSLTESMLERQPNKFALWPSVWKLLRLRARIWWNAFKRSKTRSKIGTIVVLLLILGGMVFLFIVSRLLLRFLQSPALAEYMDPSQLLGAIPTLILTAAFFLIVLTNFGVLLQSLYLSHDMDFLVTTPLPMRAVFLAKLLEAILPNFALFCAFSLPVLFGLGSSSGYTILYYPLLILMLGLLALAAGGLASILVMAVVRVVPARRVAEVLGFLGAISSILCGQSGNLINAMDPDQADVAGTLNMFTQLNTGWSPLAWAGNGLNAIGRAEWLPGIALTLLSMMLAGAIFAGSLFLAEQLYYTGWASMQGSVRRKRRQTEPRAARPVGAFRLLPRAMLGLIVKDFLLLRRDPRNLSQLITPLIVGVAMLFSTRGGGRNAAEAMSSLGLQNLEVYGLLILAVFVSWMLMSNLASLSFSREGRNYWFIKTSPIRPWHLLGGKFLVSLAPAAGFGLLYLVVAFLIRGISFAFLPYALLVVVIGMAGAAGISLAFGVAGANLDWDNPRQQNLRGSAGCLAVLAVFGFMALDLALFLLPPGLWQILNGSAPLISYLIGIVLGSLASLLGIFIPLRMVAPRLAHLGEKD